MQSLADLKDAQYNNGSLEWNLLNMTSAKIGCFRCAAVKVVADDNSPVAVQSDHTTPESPGVYMLKKGDVTTLTTPWHVTEELRADPVFEAINEAMFNQRLGVEGFVLYLSVDFKVVKTDDDGVDLRAEQYRIPEPARPWTRSDIEDELEEMNCYMSLEFIGPYIKDSSLKKGQLDQMLKTRLDLLGLCGRLSRGSIHMGWDQYTAVLTRVTKV